MTVKCDQNNRHFVINLYNPRSCRNHRFILRVIKGGYLEKEALKYFTSVLKFFEVEIARLKEKVKSKKKSESVETEVVLESIDDMPSIGKGS